VTLSRGTLQGHFTQSMRYRHRWKQWIGD